LAWPLLSAVAFVLVVLAASCARGRRSEDPAAYVPNAWPTNGRVCPIISGFGYRRDPIEGDRRFHKGLDIGAPKKSPVVATAHGVVTFADRNHGGYGKLVIINHGNGYETLYAHLSRIHTKAGKRVKRGDVIGTVGETGRATAPHLHYEVHCQGRCIDPRLVLP